jgi:SAM-dependent MidA family methyltransferase
MGNENRAAGDEHRLRALRRHLVEICHAQGPISFARYMETCLYHPELGYYAAGPIPVGPEGDFVTYPSAHPAFGRLLARQVAEAWEAMERPAPFALVEWGGGRGTLAQDLLGFIRESHPRLWDALAVFLVDQSPTLRSLQERSLRSLGGNVSPLDPDSFFARTAPFTGCVFSNEFVDALPVHWVEKRDGTIREVFVRVGENAIEEILRSPSGDRIAAHLQELGADLVEGQRAEIQLAAADWIQRLATVLCKGLVITVDFGYSGADFFHPWRPQGTLMTYKDHQASPDPYGLPGGQDLCSHVNFSALVRAGEQAGLRLTGLVTQDRFFFRLGILEEMEAQESLRDRLSPVAFWKEKLALRRLIMPQSPQGGFQVLVQHKGWQPPPLKGLS